jgi:hypothetical protein
LRLQNAIWKAEEARVPADWIRMWVQAWVQEQREQAAADGLEDPTPVVVRRRGRPGWIREDFRARWREASAAAGEGATYSAVALHFKTLDGSVGTITPEYLGKLFRKFRPLDPK